MGWIFRDENLARRKGRPLHVRAQLFAYQTEGVLAFGSGVWMLKWHVIFRQTYEAWDELSALLRHWARQ
ncbi:hypothetical protein BBD39_07705 [Arsenophonus endosymbiont of Bemisia tabaci Asia II 3]|nr:hypothetical protein BBD39_07705 [Arsenophonus endosymbiont of Bemisia tabaci Asia II 3]